MGDHVHLFDEGVVERSCSDVHCWFDRILEQEGDLSSCRVELIKSQSDGTRSQGVGGGGADRGRGSTPGLIFSLLFFLFLSVSL